MGDDKAARGWLDRLFSGATRAERADYEPRIHGEHRQPQHRPPAAGGGRTREHGDGRAAG